MHSGWIWLRSDDTADIDEENQRLHAVLGHCPRCIAMLDIEGVLVGYNREFAGLFDVPPVVGQPVAQLFEEGARAMLGEVIAGAGTTRRASALLTLRTSDGAERNVEFLAAAVPGDGSGSIGVVLAGDDRTVRVTEETERLATLQGVGAANLNDAIGLAQAALCHDLNNALTAATLWMDQLRQATAASPNAQELLAELQHSMTFASDLVVRAQSAARAQFAPRVVTADLRECVTRAVRVVAPLAPRGRVSLALDVRSDGSVALGPTEVTQVLTNLLTNSLHAIEDAGRPGRIDVIVECSASACVVTVRDDGVGIEPAALLLSFDSFQTTRAAQGGTGLGLGIARTLVEAAGGRIDVLSTPGRSTEMRIELPRVPAPESPAAAG